MELCVVGNAAISRAAFCVGCICFVSNGANLCKLHERVTHCTAAIAKPPQARFPGVSGPSVRCSTSESPHDWRSLERCSRDGGVLTNPNWSGSPAALVAALAERQYNAVDVKVSVVK